MFFGFALSDIFLLFQSREKMTKYSKNVIVVVFRKSYSHHRQEDASSYSGNPNISLNTGIRVESRIYSSNSEVIRREIDV